MKIFDIYNGANLISRNNSIFNIIKAFTLDEKEIDDLCSLSAGESIHFGHLIFVCCND